MAALVHRDITSEKIVNTYARLYSRLANINRTWGLDRAGVKGTIWRRSVPQKYVEPLRQHVGQQTASGATKVSGPDV